MTQLFLLNTETRKKELFAPMKNRTCLLYTCGPTVYDYAHIGNFRTFIIEDILRKTLKFFGYRVVQAMNLTDVDDKTIRGALQEKVSLEQYTKKYTEAFFDDLKTARCEAVEYYPAATHYIPQMIDMIETLMKKGIAYTAEDGSVYYSIAKFPSYGKLSHLKFEDLHPGISVRTDEYTKEHASDFVLWKAYDPERDGTIFWESPFGKGRPGWHLECSVMAKVLLGDSIDIHAGGVDLIFPHHENEVAQSEACSGKCFARYWIHVEHLLVEHKKMSKSLGNFFTLRDIIKKGYSGAHIRMLFLQTHYRTQLNFTFQALDAVKSSLQRLQDFIFRLEQIQETRKTLDELAQYLQDVEAHFARALGDDLNTADALSVIFEIVRHVNSLADTGKLGKEDALAVLALLQKMDFVLSIMNFQKEEIPSDIQALVEERTAARVQKNWARSDAIRDELQKRGYVIEDTPTGPRAKKI
jgi:cysteinyl-tRNA synthetase